MPTSTTPTVSLETFTPQQARAAIAKRHPKQRRIHPGKVADFKRFIEEDLWFPFTAAPGAFSPENVCLNAYHRLTAIGSLPDDHPPVPLLVARNVPERALPFIDTTQSVRSLADELGYNVAGIEYAKEIASILPLVMHYAPPGKLVVDKAPGISEALAFTTKHRDRLVAVAKLAHRVGVEDGKTGSHRAGIATTKTLGWLLFQTWDHPDAAQFWIDYYCLDYHAKEDPRGQMVAYYRGDRAFAERAQGREANMRRAVSLAEAWNAHIEGRTWRPWDGKRDTFPHPITAPACGKREAA